MLAMVDGTATTTREADGPLGIVAGAGGLPWEAATAIAPRRPVVVFAIDHEADPVPQLAHGIAAHRFSYGQLGRLRRLALEAKVRDVLLLGTVSTRPDFAAMVPDLETLRLLPRIVRSVVGGDDTIVRNLVAMIEEEGFRVVSVADAVPELLAAPGPVGRCLPGSAHAADIAMGVQYLEASAPFDVGQGVVVVEGRIVAVEGAEGTDAMLDRVAEVRARRRFRAAKGSGVLVKRAKRGQEMRTDVPVIGAATLAGVVKAGLGGIAIEAGRTIVAERVAVARAADKAGVFVVAQ